MVPTPSRQQQVRSRLGARPVLSRLLNELPLETRVEDRHAEEIKPTTATDSELSCKVRTRRSNQLGLNCLDFATEFSPARGTHFNSTVHSCLPKAQS